MGIREELLEFFFPRRCVLCTSLHRSGLCEQCQDLLTPFPPGEAEVEGSPQSSFCKAASFGPYREKISKVIWLLKYEGRRYLSEILGELMADYFVNRLGWGGVDGIVPVPLSPQKEKKRGFNQALLLAEHFAATLALRSHHLFVPVIAVLEKTRETEDQFSLPAHLRKENVAGAFSLLLPQGQVEGKSLLLFDDVLTTGSTAQECSVVLLRGGAREVRVYTFARADCPADPSTAQRRGRSGRLEGIVSHGGRR